MMNLNNRRVVGFTVAGAVVVALAASVAWAQVIWYDETGEQGVAVYAPHSFHAYAQEEDQEEDARRRIVVEIPQGRWRWSSRPWTGIAFSDGRWFSHSDIARKALSNADEIELTDEQREMIRDAQRAYRREEIQRDASIEIGELELEELFEDDAGDLGEIEQQLRALANLRVDDQMAALRLDRQVRDMLTIEQLEELEELDDHVAILRSIDEIRDLRRERRR